MSHIRTIKDEQTLPTAVKKEENLTFSKKVKMRTGEGPEPERRKWRLYNERLSNIVNDFDKYDPMEYLYCIDALFFTSLGDCINQSHMV